MFSFGITNTTNLPGLIVQVSKISFAGFCIFVLLFQQLVVGSEAASTAVPDTVTSRKDTFPADDKTLKITNDSIVADTIKLDTNVVQDESLKFPVKYHAKDSIRVNIADEIVYLFGAATVDYDDMHLESERIVINMADKELYAEGVTDSLGNLYGTPKFSQGGQEFRSNNIRYNFDSKKGKISYVITKEGEGFIHGEVVKKDPENNFFIRKGQYTTCDLDTPHFAITSNKIKVISKNKIVTGPAYLTIENIPTPLLLPFGFFPNSPDRTSGLIFPSFGESADRGFYFQELGYYFGFSDYINLAIATDLYTKGSYSLKGSTIYKKRYRYAGNIVVSSAYTVISEKEQPDYRTQQDYQITWNHTQDPKLNPLSNFSANVRAGSSTYYANTISSQTNFLTNTFQSSVNYSRIFPDKPINFTIAATHMQNSITRDIRVAIPDVSFNVSRINPLKRKYPVGPEKWYEKIGTSYSMRATNFIETKDSLLFRNESLDNFKNGIQHTIPFSTSFNVLKYFNLSPSLNYSERWYFRTTQFSWDPETKKVDTNEVREFKAARDYQASLSLATRMYGMYLFKGGSIAAVRHVVTPTMAFSMRPDFGDTKYGYYKYVQTDTTGRKTLYSIFQNSVYGGPSAGPFASLSFGLDNNIEMKVRTDSDTGEVLKKVKILESLSLSSNYNFIADSMKLGLISLNGRTTLLDRINLSIGSILNPYSYDENNNDYDQYMVADGGRLVRITSASASMSFSLNKTTEQLAKKYSTEELEYIRQHPEEYVDFSIPFNLSASYSFSYNKRGSLPANRIQTVSFNGDFSLTPQWKFGFGSWYDITNGRVTSLSLNIYRDLHCWEMRFNWIPFGFQESWNFQINVRASTLKDLKMEKRKSFFD